MAYCTNDRHREIRPLRPSNDGLDLRLLLGTLSLSLVLFSWPVFVQATGSAASPVMLPTVYHGDAALTDYWVSEKYDGVRGYWDGEKLLTKSGERIAAPAWFTADWPKQPLDGELRVARGQFLEAVSVIKQKVPVNAAWRTLHFMVFDLPADPRPFSERDAALKAVIAQIGQPWVRHVQQRKLADKAALQALFKSVLQQDGEGLMLHRGASLYRAARNDDLQKLKPSDDAEARVVAHLPGSGKYAGEVGALEVESASGLRFRVGSGLSDAERRNPPPLGSWVTYRYTGLNEKTGIPRFPRFMRLREDMAPSFAAIGATGITKP